MAVMEADVEAPAGVKHGDLTVSDGVRIHYQEAGEGPAVDAGVPAAPGAAPAAPGRFAEGHMAELACGTGRAPYRAASLDQSAPQTGLEVQVHRRARARVANRRRRNSTKVYVIRRNRRFNPRSGMGHRILVSEVRLRVSASNCSIWSWPAAEAAMRAACASRAPSSCHNSRSISPTGTPNTSATG